MCERDLERTPKKSNIEIVQLNPDYWQVLRDIKIRSLKLEPIAFEDQASGLAKYTTRSEQEWRSKLDQNKSSAINLFAKDGEDYAGTVNAVVDLDNESALVQHMYVDPEYRGKKVGRMLLEDLLGKLKGYGVLRKAKLTVVDAPGQLPARRLYDSLGFVEVRRFEEKREDEAVVEIEMEKDLTSK